MPIVARALTAPEVAGIEAPGTHAVGGVTGLCLQVTATGARSWLLRIKVGERRREFGLGAYPTVPLPDARDQARGLRRTIGGGVDPIIQRRVATDGRLAAKSRTLTFKACAEAFVRAELAAARNARYVAGMLANLQRVPKRPALLPGIVRPKGEAGTTAHAYALGCLAKDAGLLAQEPVVAVLFRDSDGTRSAARNLWQGKVDAIHQGFRLAGFETGVAMVPRPKSEAWLLCALKPRWPGVVP